MKTLSTFLATAILTFSASVSAGASSELSQEQAIDSLVKKLTMSCYRNREGDRLFVGAVETVRFCQNAASKPSPRPMSKGVWSWRASPSKQRLKVSTEVGFGLSPHDGRALRRAAMLVN